MQSFKPFANLQLFLGNTKEFPSQLRDAVFQKYSGPTCLFCLFGFFFGGGGYYYYYLIIAENNVYGK